MKKQDILSRKIKENTNLNYDSEFVVSGRSAIDFAIKDIESKNKSIDKKVLLPYFICESMVEPFIKNNWKIDFYNVNFEKGVFNIDINKIKNSNYDCILLCDYFIPNLEIYNKLCNTISSKTILIHDVTQTLFSNKLMTNRDDYIVCSLRKWFTTTDGGLISSKNGFSIETIGEHEKYLELKNKARFYKEKYYTEKTKETKKQYKLYSEQAEEELNSNFSNFSMSEASIKQILEIDFNRYFMDKKEIYKKICKLLKQTNYSLIENLDEDNCLFTIPIIIEEKRDEVLDIFYDNLIRCAILWEYNEYNNDIFNYFIENSICIDITDNTYKQLKKVVENQ